MPAATEGSVVGVDTETASRTEQAGPEGGASPAELDHLIKLTT
jgi:hypothetical protein